MFDVSTYIKKIYGSLAISQCNSESDWLRVVNLVSILVMLNEAALF